MWRAGELYPIDVGDGLTMEQRPVEEVPRFMEPSEP